MKSNLRINKNSVRCLNCNQTLENRRNPEYIRCKCNGIAISGGYETLRREVSLNHSYEELSEYEIGWRDILDCKVQLGYIGKMEALCRTTGYSCFLWNDRIYILTNDGFEDTGKTVSDLSGFAPPCIIKAV